MKTFQQFCRESYYITERLHAYGQLRYGSTSAKATDQSISSAVDKALASPGTSQSASSEKGKTGVTGSGYIHYSGITGSRSQAQSQPQSRTKPAATKPAATKPAATKPVVINKPESKPEFKPESKPKENGSSDMAAKKAYAAKYDSMK